MPPDSPRNFWAEVQCSGYTTKLQTYINDMLFQYIVLRDWISLILFLIGNTILFLQFVQSTCMTIISYLACYYKSTGHTSWVCLSFTDTQNHVEAVFKSVHFHQAFVSYHIICMLIFNVQSVNFVKSFGSVATSNTSIEGFVKYIDMSWIPVGLIVVSFVAEVRQKFFPE